MLHSHRSVGSLSTPGKSIRKQQSENFGGSTRRREPSNASALPRPTNEFGWQLALQGVTLGAKETIVEEETPREIQDGSDPPNLTLRDSASDATLTTLSSPPASHSSPSNEISRSYSVLSSLSSSSTKRELAEKYADKDIGWQLALQAQDIPHILPSQADRSPKWEGTNPYSGVDVTSRESPRPTHTSAEQDTFQQLNLDEAAKIYSGFATSETAVQPSVLDDPSKSPQVTRTPSYLVNNPFHAMIQAAEAARNPLLIDLEDEKPAVVPKLASETRTEPPQGSSSPVLRQPEDNNGEDQLSCELCPKQQVPVNRISQIPSCLHLVCHNCLLPHIQRQLFDSYFPVKCPVCLLLEDHSDDSPQPVSTNHGVVTLEIVQNFKALAPSTFDIFESFQISSQSSQVFCPKCQETMLVDRTQYLQESIITCPRGTCGHRWCKSCFKDMANPGAMHSTHKCKPDKLVGVRACPECGYQGRRVAGDNFIPCRGVGCRIHFCFKCGETIVDRSTKPQDTATRIEAHYDKCTRYSKDDKCTVQ